MTAINSSPISLISTQLKTHLPADLVDDLLKSYQELRKHSFLGDNIPAGVHAGRFSETCIRILQYIVFKNYTPLTTQLGSFPTEVSRLANSPASSGNDSVRLMIPKILQVVYDLRNKRNIGHTGGDVDSNYVDSTLAATCCGWVLAELIRIYYAGKITEAQKLVDLLVQSQIPLIQEFSGDLKILKGKLPVSFKILALLSYRKNTGMTLDEITSTVGKKHANNIRTTLCNLDDDGHIYKNEKKRRYFITAAGEKSLSERISAET